MVTRPIVIRRALFALVFAGLAVHLALALLGGEGPVLDWLYTGLELGALGLVAWRVAAVRSDRVGWALITLGLALWTAGDLCWTLWLGFVGEPPVPNLAAPAHPGGVP